MVRKYLLLVCFLLFFAISLIAKEYNEYEAIELAQYAIGVDENQLGIISGEEIRGYSGPDGPTALDFIEGKLVIADALNSRIVELDNSYKFSKIMKIPIEMEMGRLLKRGGAYYYYSETAMIMAFTQEGKILFNYNRNHLDRVVFRNPRVNLESLYFANDLFILKDSVSDNYMWFENITTSSNIKPIYKNLESSIQELKNRNIFGLLESKVGFIIENNMIIEEQSLNLNFKKFVGEWRRIHKNRNLENPYVLDFTLREKDFGGIPNFIGFDSIRNAYWVSGTNGVIVFDKNGWLIDIFIPKGVKSITRPAVHPSGDIYFLAKEENSIGLYKIQKQWPNE